MLRIEDKLTQTKASLQALREQVDQALADVPPALSLGENMNAARKAAVVRQRAARLHGGVSAGRLR